MPARPLLLHPSAFAETQAAFDWYRERNLSVAQAFLAELDRAFSRMAERPEVWPRYAHGTQRYLLHRFPFFVVYRVTSDRIEVIAVAHARRKPGYWRNRA